MKIHEKYMRRCIQLAKNGLGTTYPNPLVGCVIVHNETIIGEGWHYKSGKPHAEVNAIDSVVDKSLLKNATLYVSLEPCSHFGKTPPCSNLIIESGIRTVVVGSTDPNPKVAGKGIEKLMDAGCNVTTTILEDECSDLNKRFFTFHSKKRPYIILKWAQSKDGFIAPAADKRSSKAEPVWITNTNSRQLVHKMRSQEQSILIGTQTAIDDNPSLTTRSWSGSHPIRLVIDRELKISKDHNIFDGSAKTIVFTEKELPNKSDSDMMMLDFSKDLPTQICDFLFTQQIQSVIIEGGARTLQSFIIAGLWDEAKIFIGDQKFNYGVEAPKLEGDLISENTIQGDRLNHYKNTRY